MRSFISSRRPVIREDRLSFRRDLTYSDFSPIASDERATQVEQYYLLTATIKWKRDLNVLKIESSLTLRYFTYCGIKQQQKKTTRFDQQQFGPRTNIYAFRLYLFRFARNIPRNVSISPLSSLKFVHSDRGCRPRETLNEERITRSRGWIEGSLFEKRKGRERREGWKGSSTIVILSTLRKSWISFNWSQF